MTDETEKTPARVESVIKSMIEARVARERAEAELAEKKAQEKSLRDRMALLEAALQSICRAAQETRRPQRVAGWGAGRRGGLGGDGGGAEA